MKKFQFYLSVFLAFALIVPFTSCGDDDSDDAPTPQSIVEIATSDSQFSTLVAALDRVGLVGVLEGDGPFTVFAPTDAAFQAAGVTDLNAFTDEQLTEILLYHVLGAEVFSGDIADGQTYVTTAATTGPGNTQLSMLIEKSAAGVVINGGINVTTADVDATNGVIHIVDNVILPLDVVGHAVANSNFTSLVSSLQAASGDLVNVLSGDGPFTVFAPLNSGFDAISTVTADLTADQLATVLTYHVVAGNVLSSTLTDGQSAETINTENITINIDGSNVTITDANGGSVTVVLTDVQGTNGVIHVIDNVLIPANL
ncbi:MAG: fasciclin domain-containing protein [Bacteroidota bacterium]